MERIGRARVGLLAVAFFLATSLGHAQVLQQVPSDAMVVLRVKNLQATSDKIGKFAQDTGIATMQPQAGNPLAEFQNATHMKNGLDSSGEMAVVFVDPASTGGDPEQAVMALIPVTDYKAFLSNWADAVTEGDISTIKFAGEPKDTYVASWGKYAALSSSKTLVSTKPTVGITPPKTTAKEMESQDIVVYANFATLRAKLLPQVQGHRAELIDAAEKGIANVPQAAQYAPVIKAMMGQAFNIAEESLTDTQGAMIGWSVSPEGINSTVLAEFAPGSYAATNVAGAASGTASLVAGLPAGKYLVYGGSDLDSKVTSKLLGDLIDPVIAELVKSMPDHKAVDDYVAALKTLVAARRGGSMGVLAPSGAIGVDPVIQFVSVVRGDAKAMMDASGKMADVQPLLLKEFNFPETQMMQSTHTVAAKTIDGVQFDSIVNKVDMNAQDPAAVRQAQLMAILYGPQGQVMNYGVVGDKLLIASGVSDEVISQLITSSKSDKSPLEDSAGYKAVSAKLPSNRFAAIYINLGDIINTGLTYARNFGMAMPFQMPTDLPPIGVTASTQETSVRIDSHVPTALVKTIVDAASAMQAQQTAPPTPQGGGL